MPEAPGSWAIRDLSNLILGVAPTPSPGLPSAHSTPAARATQPPVDQERTLLTEVVLVNPAQEPILTVSRYADYWSNHGQSVMVVWTGQSGDKIGFFDYPPGEDWPGEAVKMLEAGRFNDLREFMGGRVRRLVIALLTRAGWKAFPFLGRCDSVCALLEPSPNQLIGAYEALKRAAQLRSGRGLCCFVQEALSARQATELATRLQGMGRRFLECDIAFAGFNLAVQGSSSNLAAETFISGTGRESSQLLDQLLLACSGGIEVVKEASTAVKCEPEGARWIDPDCASEHGHAPSAFPVLRLIPLDAGANIENATQLDLLVGERIQEVCTDVIESWPVYAPRGSAVRLRWAIRESGARLILITAIDCPPGALEQAAAQLHPPQAGDEIMVVARMLTTSQRQAAMALRTPIRMFELALLPADHAPAMALREVGSAV